ncbi:MAG: GGDEF domain-containing protein [Solirubrobacteraceae bacterium]|nr:GGDEF domain-containing protein [Solirubrobacteraceae bacterium]
MRDYPFTHPFGPSDPQQRRHNSRRLMRMIMVLLLGIGTFQLLTAPLLPDPDPRDHEAMVRAGIVFACMTAGVAIPWRMPDWLTVSLPAIAMILMGLVVSIATPLAGTTFFFLWPMLLAVYFLRPRETVVTAAIGLTALAVGLAVNPYVDDGTQLFVDTVIVNTVVSFLVLLLKDRGTKLVTELRVSAATDGLTGLALRTVFDAELRSHAAGDDEVSVVFLDVDHFKEINDTHGHLAGDEVLRALGRELREIARDGDIVARLGGEEFGVLLPGTGRAEALAVAERICATVRTAGCDPAITVSAGVASTTGGNADSVLSDADAALYAAKRQGRDRVVVADPHRAARLRAAA